MLPQEELVSLPFIEAALGLYIGSQVIELFDK